MPEESGTHPACTASEWPVPRGSPASSAPCPACGTACTTPRAEGLQEELRGPAQEQRAPENLWIKYSDHLWCKREQDQGRRWQDNSCGRGGGMGLCPWCRGTQAAAEASCAVKGKPLARLGSSTGRTRRQQSQGKFLAKFWMFSDACMDCRIATCGARSYKFVTAQGAHSKTHLPAETWREELDLRLMRTATPLGWMRQKQKPRELGQRGTAGLTYHGAARR